MLSSTGATPREKIINFPILYPEELSEHRLNIKDPIMNHMRVLDGLRIELVDNQKC